jgi:hypothetical protein
MGIFGISSSGTRNKFADGFDDTFDEATDGSLWKSLLGTWSVVSGKASSSSAANTYPIASIDMPENQGTTTISMKSMGQGTGAALWITDSGTWWAVVAGTDAGFGCSCTTQSNFKCSTYACNAYICNTFNCPSPNNCITTYCAAVCSPGNACTNNSVANNNAITSYNACNAYNFGNCNLFRYNAVTPCATFNKTGNCNRYRVGGGTQYCAGNFVGNRYCRSGENAKTWATNIWNACNAWACNATQCGSFPCSPGTAYNCTSPTCQTGSCNPTNTYCSTYVPDTYFQSCAATCYPTYVRLIKSVANMVTEVTKITVGNTTSSLVNSLKLIVSGSQITAKAYSDTSLTSQIGSDLTFTPTGVTISTSYGIIVTPSVTNQGNSLDDFTIETE